MSVLRRTVSALAAASAAVVLAVPGGATASPGSSGGGSRMPADDDVPTVEQAAELFPALEGGTGTVRWHPAIYVRLHSCVTEGPWDAGNGLYTDYRTADGSESVPVGEAGPYAMAYEFDDDSTVPAGAIMRKLDRAAARCEGAHTQHGRTIVSHQLADPPLGTHSVAWRTRSTNDFGEPVSLVFSYVQVGNRISYTKVFRRDGRVGQKLAARWQALAFDTYLG